MQARLVAVVVDGLDAGEGVDLLPAPEARFGRGGEDAVEAVVEGFPADGLREPDGVVGHVEGVLHGVALLEAAPGFVGVEVADEAAVGQPRLHEFVGGVEEFAPAVGEADKPVVVVRLVHRPGQLGGGVGAEAVLEGVGAGEVGGGGVGMEPLAPVLLEVVAEGYVAVFGEGLYVHLAGAEGAVAVGELVGDDGLVGEGGIVVADARLVGGGDGQAHEVGAHPGDELAVGQPVGEPAAVAVQLQLSADVVVVPLGVGERPQLGDVPEAAPDGVGIQVGGAGAVGPRGQAAGPAAVAGVVAVDVAGDAPAEQGVVEAGVELGLVVLVGALHAELAEFPAPGVLGGGAGLVEGEGGGLRFQVGAGVRLGGVGEAYLQFDGFAFLGAVIEHQSGALAGGGVGVGLLSCGGEGADARGGLAEFGVEVHVDLAVGVVGGHVLGVGADGAGDVGGVDPAYGGVGHRAALALGVADVEDDVGAVGGGKGVAVEADAGGGGEFRRDAVVVEQYAVVAGFGYFLLPPEAGAVAGVGRFQVSGPYPQFADGRHEADAAHLPLVEVHEALDGGLPRIVAHGFPARGVAVVGVGGGGQLGHAVGYGRRGVEEPAAVGGAEVGIHVGEEVLGGNGIGGEQQGKGEGQQAEETGHDRVVAWC